MSDTFLPGNGFDTYEEQDKVLVGLGSGRGCRAAVRILQQQGFAVAGAVVRLSAEDDTAAAAKEAAKALGIQCIATGHHARVETDAEGVSRICPAADPASDESAALAALPQETLARLILPLGEFSPEELDDLAEELKF